MENPVRTKQDCIAAFATFDGVGNRLSLTYPTGGVVHFTYDPLDQVSTVSRTAGGLTRSLATFAYEGAGRPGRMTRANSINTRLLWNGMKNPPNAQGDSGWGQVSSVNHQVAGGGATIDRRTSAYDPNQNKILRRQTLPFATGVPALTTNVFGYDALNRMTSFSRRRASAISTKSLALDKQGNRQTVSSNGVVGIYAMDSGTPEPADFQMNQYTITPFGTEQHDLNGNLIAIDTPAGATQFSYDFADRLVLVQRNVGPALVPVASFTYDALGRRISKTTFPNAPALPVTTYFVLDPDSDDDSILEERVDGVARVFAVWPHMHKMGGHARISPTGETRWVHTDETGTALALTDDAGTVLERYDYREAGEPMFFTAEGVPMVDAFGQPVAQSPAGSHHLFNGLQWDGETGLYFEAWPCRWKAPELNAQSDSRYLNPKTDKPLTHVHGDPHVDQKDGTRWDFNQSGGGGGGAGGMRAGISTSRSNLRNKNSFHGGGDGSSSSGADGKKGLNAVNVKLARMSSANVVNKVTVRGWDPEKKTSFAVLMGGGGSGAGGIAIDESGVHFVLKKEEGGRHTPFQNRSAIGNGSAGVFLSKGTKGCTVGGASEEMIAFEYSVKSPRDSASGQATGRRSYTSGRFILDLDGQRDASSGLPTGRRLHSPRDASSGLATGKRQHLPIGYSAKQGSSGRTK